MINQDVVDIQEFRRFISQNIYPETFFIIIDNIKYEFGSDEVSFEAFPKPLIKFNLNINNINSETIDIIHKKLYKIFTNYFNNKDIIKLCRTKAYEAKFSLDKRCNLANTLTGIQLGNCNHIGLLYNITILDNVVYLFL